MSLNNQSPDELSPDACSLVLLIHKIIYLVYLLCDAVPLLIFPEAQLAYY